MNYARVAVFELVPHATDQVVQLAQRELVPMVRGLPGFVGYELVVIAHDRIASYSVWRTQRDAQDAAGLIKLWVDANLAGLVRSSDIHLGQVVISTAPEPVVA